MQQDFININHNQVKVLNQYQLNKLIGNGRYSTVFEGIDTLNEQPISIKIESKLTKYSHIEKESQILKQLNKSNSKLNIPKIIDFGSDDKYRYMITQLFGPSIEQVFNDCKRKFNLFTISQIGQQLITIFKEIHSKQLVYLNLKPQTVLIGRNEYSNYIYLTSFGLAQYKQQFQFENSFLSPFCSKNSYNRGLMTEVDDLESLGTLPWINIEMDDNMNKFEQIREIKLNTSFYQLSLGTPQQMNQYFQLISSLGIESLPKYDKLIELMKQMEKEQEFDQLDWIQKKE